MRILTFDIEDWFHILDNQSTKNANDWNNFESRIHSGTDKILNILDDNNQDATFFALGWIAEKYPEVIKKIDEAGFEIGNHTYYHQLLYETDKKSFLSDLDKTTKIIEDITGKKTKYFRAPGFSITSKNLWALEAIYESGINIDCSIFPAGRAHGGLPEFTTDKPAVIKISGYSIKEFPINTVKVLNGKYIYSGGGYFRLLPYSVINQFTKKQNYIMTYFHPRDFDYKQPMINDLPAIRKFKSYVGLKSAEKKLIKWINDFEFIDLNTADNLTDWKNVPEISLYI